MAENASRLRRGIEERALGYAAPLGWEQNLISKEEKVARARLLAEKTLNSMKSSTTATENSSQSSMHHLSRTSSRSLDLNTSSMYASNTGNSSGIPVKSSMVPEELNDDMIQPEVSVSYKAEHVKLLQSVRAIKGPNPNPNPNPNPEPLPQP